MKKFLLFLLTTLLLFTACSKKVPDTPPNAPQTPVQSPQQTVDWQGLYTDFILETQAFFEDREYANKLMEAAERGESVPADAFERMKRVSKPHWQVLLIIPFAIIAQWLNTDYGGWGIALIALFSPVLSA